MSIKEQLRELFLYNVGVNFSGQELAGRLGVSRAAVWKAVKSLQNEGYAIDAATNRGYMLSEDADILSESTIARYLNCGAERFHIEVFDKVTSTNTLAREKAVSGALEGHVVIASEQTSGRGRLGRSFYSPSGTGVYLSLILRPSEHPSHKASSITTVAAVAVCEAIEAVSGRDARIKWVNDVFMDGRKVCGILTEASVGLESGLLEYAVLGVGVNVCRPRGDFPTELENIAGAVLDKPLKDAKNRLCAEFLRRFMNYYGAEDDGRYKAEYKRRSLALGRSVTVIRPDGKRAADALDIDGECRLLVRYGDGSQEYLSSGEISIRL